VARSRLFGSRTAPDRDHDGVDDRAEVPAEARTNRVIERDKPVLDRDRDGVDDRDETLSMRHSTHSHRSPLVDRDRDETPTAPIAPVSAKPAAQRTFVHPRASMAAAVGVMVGLVGVAAALTGLLAPFGVVLGVLGLLFSVAGVNAGRRPNVAGRGLGALGLLVSFVAIGFSVLALTHSMSWLDSSVDQVATLRDWLNAQLPWMKNW
jgi:hypothetical protein